MVVGCRQESNRMTDMKSESSVERTDANLGTRVRWSVFGKVREVQISRSASA